MITSDEAVFYIFTVPEGKFITPEHIYRHFGTQILPVEFYLNCGRIPPLLSEAKVGDECRIYFTETIDLQ